MKTQQRERTLREQAVRYGQRGLAIFPLAPRGKEPLIAMKDGGHGCKDATCDTATIDAWWEREPAANIGMHCGSASGSVFVVDVDNKLPKIAADKIKPGETLVRGTEVWAEIVALVGGVPETLTQDTGGGGLQLFFKLPKGRSIKNFNKGLRISGGRIAAIDVKTDGGYVLLPPSIHPETGRAYAWRVPGGREAAECPAALLDLFFPPEAPAAPVVPPRVAAPSVGDSPERRYCLAVLQTACNKIAGATAGGRHATLNGESFVVGGYVTGNPGALGLAEAEAALVAAGIAAGKSEREVRRTVMDALTKGGEKPIPIPERAPMPGRNRGPEAPIPDERDAPWDRYAHDEDPGPPPELDGPPPRDDGDPGPEVAELLQEALAPKINVSGKQGSKVVAETWRVILEGNREKPELFRLGGKLARLHRHEGGAVIELCLPVHVHGQLMRSARWMRSKRATERDREIPTKDGWIELDLEGGPPAFVSADMVASPRRDLPAIETVVYAPTLGRDGGLLIDPGYHASDALWYEAERAVRTVRMSVPEARGVLEDWLADFPFARQSDRAHALALFLLPFVRRLIDGPTPVHLLEAPQPGTGKSLLGQVLMRVAHGRDVPLAPWDRDEKERKKTITTYLMAGRAVVFFDNVKGQISSESFENATTSRRWVDRVLGITGDVEVPIFAVWLMTSNNATMSPDMARRTCRIRLVRHTPFDATTARHPDIEAWTDEHRDELVSAALTLIGDWLLRGRPGCSGTLATYEAWARVVGGILANAGVEGFLSDRAEFLERADPTTAEWAALVEAWIADCDGAGRSATDLLQLCDKLDVLQRETEGSSERARATRFGSALRARIDASFGGRQLRVRRVAGCPTYYLTREAE